MYIHYLNARLINSWFVLIGYRIAFIVVNVKGLAFLCDSRKGPYCPGSFAGVLLKVFTNSDIFGGLCATFAGVRRGQVIARSRLPPAPRCSRLPLTPGRWSQRSLDVLRGTLQSTQASARPYCVRRYHWALAVMYPADVNKASVGSPAPPRRRPPLPTYAT